MLASYKQNYDKPIQYIKKQRHHFVDKGLYSQSNGQWFLHSHVRMWELDHKEGCVPKNWCFPTVVLEKTFQSSLDCKEMKPSILMEINLKYLLEGLMLTEDPILWAPDGKSQLAGKDPDARKDWKQKEKRMAEDEMVSITNSMDMCYACAQSLQSCLTLCDPMDCSLPGSSVHEILQKRILEWVAMPSSRESCQLRDRTRNSSMSCVAGRWIWANSGRKWRTGKPSMLLGLQSRTWHNNWTTRRSSFNVKDQMFWRLVTR